MRTETTQRPLPTSWDISRGTYTKNKMHVVFLLVEFHRQRKESPVVDHDNNSVGGAYRALRGAWVSYSREVLLPETFRGPCMEGQATYLTTKCQIHRGYRLYWGQ